MVIASPDYLASHSSPAEPDDLSRHRIVGGTASVVPAAWTFERDGRRVKLELEPHFATDDNEGAIAAAVAGLGVTSTSGWACRRELEAGQLVLLPSDWSLEPIPVHAYFPLGRDTRAAARAAVEYLAAGFREEEDFWA